MRSFEDILKAKDSVATSENTLTVADLLPGYLVGGSLEFISEVAYIAPVAAAVQGKRIEISEKIRLEDCYWEVKKLNNYRYYVYLDTLAVLHVDVRAPMIINKMMGLYHPSTGWRYINTFYSNNVGRITETTVSTLNIIGYSGDGTPYAPQEGDRRVYIDEDEIRFEEYTGGAWTSVNSIVIGGADSYGNFLPFLGCRGIYNTLADPPLGQALPDLNYLIYDWENVLVDQNSENAWVETAGTAAFSSAVKKFNTYSLTHTAPSETLFLDAPLGLNTATAGESQAIATYIYMVDSGDTGNYISFYYRLGDDATDSINMRIKGNGEMEVVVYKGSTGTTINPQITLDMDQWSYIGLVYNADEDSITLVMNTQKHKTVGLSGSWGASGMGIGMALDYPNFTTSQIYLDETILRHNVFVEPDVLIQHYTSNVPWDTTYSAKDVVLKPSPGGVVNVLEGGPHGETGNIFDLVWPIGCTYTQYPGKASPVDLKLPGTWENISDEFAGDFFRAEGGNASAFESGEQAHMFQTHVHNHRHSISGSNNGYNAGRPQSTDRPVNTTMYTNYDASAPSSGNYGAETRPVNRTIRIWERTA